MTVRYEGTNGADYLSVSSSEDYLILGKSGNDTLSGSYGDDRLFGGRGDDIFYLSAGRDIMVGGAGDDTYLMTSVNGDAVVIVVEQQGKGYDTIIVRATFANYTIPLNIEEFRIEADIKYITGNIQDNVIDASARSNGSYIDGAAGNDNIRGTRGHDRIVGGTGADTMDGGDGFDQYFVDNVNDVVVEDVAHGDYDAVVSTVNYTLSEGVEGLKLDGKARRGTGNDGDNSLAGNAAKNVLKGLDGDDELFGLDGRDTLNGGDGSDLLDGGNGRDKLIGGAGDDVFVFSEASHTGKNRKTADRIVDLQNGDLIDLQTIDGNKNKADVQAFEFISDAAFSGSAGELRFKDGYLIGDRDGNGKGDFFIRTDATLGLIEDALLL